MNAAAIQTIWQAIRESERSDDLSFIDALKRSLMPRADRAPIAAAATTDPLPTAARFPDRIVGQPLTDFSASH
jgi:hypothetical protein